MERLSIEEMREIQLDLMDELDRICREQNISYFLGYGTLLGAVRHGGFIPWDDDVDVVMLRAEYERLIAGFNAWKSSDRFALSFYRDGKSIYPFAKLVDTTTCVYENFVDKKRTVGVWVDLFPLDDVDPADVKPFKRNAWAALVRSFIVADPSVGSNAVVKLAKRIVCPFAHRLDPVKYARKVDENAMRAYPHGGGSDIVADIVGEGKPHFLFPKHLFEPMEMKFEDRTYLVPVGFEEFMNIQYGDWRTPPDEGDREIHTFEAYRL